MKTIYCAHHLWKYDTEIEKYETDLIKKHFPGCTVINPNGDIQHEDMTNEARIMDKCLSTVERCDGLVFSSLTGVVGHGVYDEVRHADKLGKPVWHIKNNELVKGYFAFDVISESRRVYAVVR